MSHFEGNWKKVPCRDCIVEGQKDLEEGGLTGNEAQVEWVGRVDWVRRENDRGWKRILLGNSKERFKVEKGNVKK